MGFTLNVADWIGIGALGLILNFLTGIWIKARLDQSIKSEYDRHLEEYRYSIRIREQAAKAAEYLAFAITLEASEEKAIYRRVNQLGWELALSLPAEEYKVMVEGIARPNDKQNVQQTLIRIRSLLLSNPGDLTADNIAFHAPNAGEKKS